MATWLVPFKGRKLSGVYNQNFVWQHDNVYIMDNHRAALWCWVQHIMPREEVNLIHIDQHSDTLYSRIGTWVDRCPDLWSIDLDEYLNFIHEISMGSGVPLFRWDNYASIFLEKHGHFIDTCIFATHNKGDKPRHRQVQYYDPWTVPANLEYWLNESKRLWICNIDLDYFVYRSFDDKQVELFSNDYFLELFTAVRNQTRHGTIKVLTICLSPECCGGWEMAESLCYRACEILGLDFVLPGTSRA